MGNTLSQKETCIENFKKELKLSKTVHNHLRKEHSPILGTLDTSSSFYDKPMMKLPRGRWIMGPIYPNIIPRSAMP